MKVWVGLVGWPIADGLPILVVTHQLQVERRTGKVRRPETDVLPRCYATNYVIKRIWYGMVLLLLLLLLLLLHPFNGLFSRTTWVSRYQKVRTSLDLNDARDDGVWGCSDISWTMCKQSAPRSRQITTPASHHSSLFLTPMHWRPVATYCYDINQA